MTSSIANPAHLLPEYPLPDARGRFGRFGGRYVPETLIPALDELEAAYASARQDPAFLNELDTLLREFVGRPSGLYFAANLTRRAGGAKIYLKREDLNHTGAHKINNCLGQALLAKRMGKQRVIAETGAGQHGVASATACALLGLECIVYMGAEDIRRQELNVFRMKLLGAEVREVTSGTSTLKDATNEAIRDWVTNVRDTFYILGSVVGPHPYPAMVRDFQSIIGEEVKWQMQALEGRSAPDAIVACVGGGSNAIGIFAPFAYLPQGAAPKAHRHRGGGRGRGQWAARGECSGRQNRCAARLDDVPAQRRRGPDPARPQHQRGAGLPRYRARALLLQRERRGRVHPRHRRRGAGGAATAGPRGRHHSRAGVGARHPRRDATGCRDWARVKTIVVNLSGRGDKDVAEVARLLKAPEVQA